MASYREYTETLQAQAMGGPIPKELTADMIAATILMQRDANAPVNEAELKALSNQISRQPAFRMLREDPACRDLVREGKGLALIEKMADKESERKVQYERYGRPEELAAADAPFLRQTLKNLKNKSEGAQSGAAEREFKGKHFTEMVRQLEYAEMLADKGIQLSGEDTKKLIDAVKKCNDGGSKLAGGTHKSRTFVDNMCVLKRYMPEDEYQRYCSDINARSKKKIDPESFTEQRVMGQAKTVQELRNECRAQLQKSFSLENCAALAATSMVPLKNGMVSMADFEAQKKKLLNSGTAFRKAMQDDSVKEKVTGILKNNGKTDQLIRAINKGSLNHAGKTAQWQLNNSKEILTGGKPGASVAAKHLANIAALSSFRETADMSSGLTNKAFAERAEEIAQDPSFRKMAARYNSDPTYRNQLNARLKKDPTGASLTAEVGRIRQIEQKAATRVPGI